MTDVIQQGLDWLATKRKAHMSRAVTYRRDGESVEVSATIGETVFRIADAFGIEVRHVRRDYIIDASDLLLAGGRVEPQRGDRIEEADSDRTLTYEVMGPGGGEPDWRWSDPYRKALRIHTKLVSQEAA